MIRRTQPWFGAFAALLLLALPVHAQQTESDPFVEEEMEPGSEPEPDVQAEVELEQGEETDTAEESGRNIEKFLDLVIVRPLYLARLIVGLPFFIVYPLTIQSGYDEDVIGLLWTDPYEATFKRPLGEAPGEF